MDDLSTQYLLMANGPDGQLHDPATVVNFVDQMQLVMERSSAPRKNFLLDTTTPRGDVIITEASAMKPGNGWITLQVTEGIRRGVHEWCVKIEHQGETTDGSGLMLGIVPKSFGKYDSFISQGGGWCLSRAGKFYGHWRRQDTSSSVVFGTGDRVIFILDYEAQRMTVRVGDKSVIGEISNLAPEVYPAVSLHYRHQFVRFEYHKVHDRHAKKLNWIERMSFPHASVYLPLNAEQLEKIPLDSYVFSPVFDEREGQGILRKRRQVSDNISSNTIKDEINSLTSQEYETSRATSARLIVMIRAIQAVRRYCGGIGGVTPTEAFLDRNITSEILRKQRHALVSRGINSHGGMDAALNCGALVLIHMFSHASMDTEGTTMLPLVYNLQEYLRGIELFSLGEASAAPYHVGTSLSPEVVRLAVDNVTTLLEKSHSNSKNIYNNNNNNNSNAITNNFNNLSTTIGVGLEPALTELLVILALQSGNVSEVLRSVRYLLRNPLLETSQATLLWLQANESALTPKSYLPNFNEIFDSIEEETEQLTPFGREFTSTILSVGYDHGSIFIHTIDGLSKRSSVASAYVLVCSTNEPNNCCPQCSYSSIAFNQNGGVILLTNRMITVGLAIVIYNTVLEIRQKVALTDIPSWPLNSRYMLISSGPGDRILLVYENIITTTTSAAAINTTTITTTNTTTAAAAPITTSAIDTNTTSSINLELQVFSGTNFPEIQWRTYLQPSPFDKSLTCCVTLRKGSVIDFGAPETCLTTIGGHVTIEVWIKILEKDDASVFYQHGDRSTSGEVFLETARLEGAWRIRGGYRHDARGMCVVAAPVSPAAASHFLHVSLVFDGNWRLYFEAEEVARTKQGPQVSLETPRQRWSAGNDCVCQLAGLRVWRCGRTSREIARDACRVLTGEEPGLLCQYFFNEQNGNVVFNHVRSGPAAGRHAMIRGQFARVACFDHPLVAALQDNRLSGSFVNNINNTNSNTSHNNTNMGSCNYIVNELPKLENTHIFFDGVHLGIMEKKEKPIPGFTEMKYIHQIIFFNAKTGRSIHGSFILRHRTKMGFMGCDRSGHYWELFRTGSQNGTPNETSEQELIAVGTLSSSSVSLQDRDIFSYRYNSEIISCDTPKKASESIKSNSNEFSNQNENLNNGQQFIDIHQSKLTFGSLGLWLLNLLSSFAETSSTISDHELFSPLLDDVGVRCVQEVQILLREHCRAVKAMNSRRSANLRDSTSSSVIATALKVLIRVIRRVRDFKLHPDTIGLSEVSGSDDLRGVLHELSIIQRRRSSSYNENIGISSKMLTTATNNNNNKSTSVTNKRKESLDSISSPNITQKGVSLLGVLADIINEAGFNLPPDLAILSRVIIQEGVTLFFPNAGVRAKLLQEILDRDQQTITRSPALNVLLDAIVKSFTEITSTSALVRLPTEFGINNNNNNNNNSDMIIDDKLVVIKATLSTLMKESARQVTSQIPNEPRQHKLSLLTAMSEAIGTLQLLLFSQCEGIATTNLNGTGQQKAIENIFSIPLATNLNLVLIEYYEELFDIAETTFKTLIQRISISIGNGNIEIKNNSTIKTKTSSSATMIIDLVSSSFLAYPLHTAVTAIPLMVTRDKSNWFLKKINSLRTQYRILLDSIRNNNILLNLETSDRWPLPVLDKALLLASSWVASFMSLGQLNYLPLRINISSTNNSISSEDINTIIQEICDHPLLSAGLRQTKSSTNNNNNNNNNNNDLSIIEKLQKQRVTWEEVAKKKDPIASKIPVEVANAISLATIAVVYLSGIRLNRLTEKECIQLLAETLLKLKSTRNELLNLRSKNPTEFNNLVHDVQERCKFLLLFQKVSESECIRMSSLFLARTFTDKILSNNNNNNNNKSKGYRWRKAKLILRFQRLYHESLINGWSSIQIDASVKLVERIILLPELTVNKIKTAIEVREATALERLYGLQHMLTLFETDTISATKVASLLFGGAVGSRLQFEVGIYASSDLTRSIIRQTMYDIIYHLRDATSLSFKSSIIKINNENNTTKNNKIEDDKILPNILSHSSALCEVMNRKWLPRDFCFLQELKISEVIFKVFCSIFDINESEKLRQEFPKERTRRYEAKGAKKQAILNNSAGTSEEEIGEILLQRTSQEFALMESLNCLKSLGLQCAIILSDNTVAPNERRGCILFLNQLFGVFEEELHFCLNYTIHLYSAGQDRVLEQVSLLCTLISTIIKALPKKYLCSDKISSKGALLAFRLCVLAKILSTSITTNTSSPNIVDICISTSILILQHCHPNSVNYLFTDSEIMEMTLQTIPTIENENATLGFLFAFSLRCVSCGCSGLTETGLRCVDSLHTLICNSPWDENFSKLHKIFQHDLLITTSIITTTNALEDEEIAKANTIRLLVWIYTIGGLPTSVLGLGKKVKMSVDDALTTTEFAYIVDYSTQLNIATVLPTSSSSLVEEREILLDSLINASQNEVTLPKVDILFLFLIPALEHFFNSSLKLNYSPLIWAIIAGILRITLSILNENPSASQTLLDKYIISHIDNFAFRVSAKNPLPLPYLYELCPIIIQQLLQCPRRIPYDAVIPSSSSAQLSLQNSPSSIIYSQPSLSNELHRLLPFGAATPLPPTMFNGIPAMSNSIVSRSDSDNNNNNNNNISTGILHSLSRLPQAHSSLCLTPSVLCFSGTKETLGGTLTVKSTGRKCCIPVWTDGVTLEASILLYDRLFPELGEDFVIPSSWQRPNIYFNLFSLYDKSNMDTLPILRLLLTENSVECILENSKGSTTIVSTKLLREDWDHWIHLSLVLESKTITLYKDGIGSTAILPKLIGSRLEVLLREGGVDRLVLGNDNSYNEMNDKSNSNCNFGIIDGMIVAIDSIRIWGCARTLKSQRTTADFVAREQTLPVISITENNSHCTFRFSEATGSETLSENKEFIGILRGEARWTPFPVFSGTVNLDKPLRYDLTTPAELPLFIPRHEFETFFAALDRLHLLRVGSEFLQSLCAHLSRQCVVAAIRQVVSPGYRVLVVEKQREKIKNDVNNKVEIKNNSSSLLVSNSSLVNIVEPQHIIASTDIIQHLINLLRYNDTGSIKEETLQVVSEFIKLWFNSINSEKQLKTSFREAAFAISEALHDELESFCIELPPLSYVTEIQLVPIASINGPGTTISFDVNSRGIEHMTFLRDRKQKVLLAKYPDAQGGWPELEIPNDNLWFYAKPIINTRSIAPSFTVSARSLKPLIACSLFGSLRKILTINSKYHCGLPYFLNTPFISLLTVRSGTTKCAALPASRLLTSIFELWRELPHFAPHDQSPLKIMLAHLNVPLMAILHRGQISPSGPPLISPAFGHYNLNIQAAFEILVAAINLEAAWKNIRHDQCTRHRWKRLYKLWENSIGFGIPSIPLPHFFSSDSLSSSSCNITSVVTNAISSSNIMNTNTIKESGMQERGYVKLVPLPSSGSPMQHRPKPTIFQRGNGVWFANCDRGSLSARSSVGFKRGRFYFEVRIPANGEAISVGVVTERAQQQSVLAPRGLGHDGESWGFESAQMCRFYHGFRHEFAVRTKWKGLDVIGILIDLEAETLACIHDDRQVSLFDNLKTNRGNGTSASFFPAVSFGTSGVDVNFGAAPFASSLPVGFLPVDPSNYMASPTSKLWMLLAAVNVGEAISNGNNNNNNNNNDNITLKESKQLPYFFENAITSSMLYQKGRSGPFHVTLLPCDNKTKMSTLHTGEVRAEEDPCFVRGSVCVREGRWYYEIVLRGDSLVSVGWATANSASDWSRTKSLGDDEESWVLEGSRTIARHNKHQRSIGGQVWKHGDIIGCMIDCNVGNIAYSVNGIPIREIHDTNGDGVLFTGVNCVNGMIPVIGVDPKNTVAIYFRDDELSFHPRGYRALGTVTPLRMALEQQYCIGEKDVKHNQDYKGNNGPFFSPLLAKHLLSSLTALTELNFMNLSAYCLEDILNKNINTILFEKFKGYNNAMRLLIILQNLTSLTECMIPYAHAALISGEYDSFLSGPISKSLRNFREYMLPAVALRLLHIFTVHTNCITENVKLTLNRRKALSIVNDMTIPTVERLRGSLFGQVYQLLHEKNISFFCTNKKLWSVNFLGEGADDIGGPYRESITQLCSELMSSALPLFIPSPNQVNDIGESREIFVVQPILNPPVRLTMYHFFGRLIAGCLRSAEPLPIYLPSRIWKVLVGIPVDITDLAMVDKAALQSYQYIRQLICSNDEEDNVTSDKEISELCPGGFSIIDDAGIEQELFPGGKGIPVAKHNVNIFLDMVLQFKLHTMGYAQIKAIADGFHQVIPVSAVSLLKWYELEQVVCGQPDYDSDALLDAARYEGITPNDTSIKYLRQVLREFSRHERALFMRFVSGRERLPSGVRLKLMPDTHSRVSRDESLNNNNNNNNNNGGNEDENTNNTSNNNNTGGGGNSSVTEIYDDNRLPHASTCFYWLSLPKYSSVEVMREKLLFAIQQCLDIDADFVVRENINPDEEEEPMLAVNVDEDEEFEDFSHLR